MGRPDIPESSLSPSDVAPPPRLLEDSRVELSKPPLQGTDSVQPKHLILPDLTLVNPGTATTGDVLAPPPPPPDRSSNPEQISGMLDLPLTPIELLESQRREVAPNVGLDNDGRIAKISYPAEGKTREFGRDEYGDINRLTTTTPNGQFSYEKHDGKWVYLSPDNTRVPAPDMMLDSNGDFSKVTKDGVALTQRLDGTSYEEEYLAVGARVQRDADGNAELVKRPDGSQIRATYHDGRLSELVESDGPDSITWKHDQKGDWVSNEVPPQTVHDLKVESNGNLSYSADKIKYTVRANGAEVEEGKGKSRFDFDDQGRIGSITSPDGKSTLSFGYHGSATEPTSIQVVDRDKNETRRYVHQPEEGGWTQVDEHNRSLGTWKGYVKVQDDGTYSIKPTGDTWTDYRTDGTLHHEEKPAEPKPAEPKSDGTESGGTRDQQVPREPKDEVEDTRPARPNLDNINEITDHSFQLKGYMLPSPDQLGAGSCLYMSATGIGEWLLNKSKGIVNPQVGGPTDLSEAWTLNLSKTVQLANNYTDAPELLSKGGALLDSQMKFKAYGTASWMSEPAIAGRGNELLPPYKKDVLFSAGGAGSQNMYGSMREQDLNNIKKYLRETQSPVLFVYKPPTVPYWHANIITGYNDKTQKFTVRDSSFGQKQTDKPNYGYDGRPQWGPLPYRNETQMSYAEVMAWGNHATGYRLAKPKD